MSRARSVQILLIAALLGVNLLAVVASTYWLDQSKQRFIQQAESHTRNIANAVERNVSSSIGKIDFALLNLVDDLEAQVALHKPINEALVHGTFVRTAKSLPEIEGLRIANDRGLVFLGGGVALTKPVSITDRDYYRALESSESKALVVSKPLMGRLVNHPIIIFARRYNHPDGSFAGVVFATVSVDHFQQMLSQFDLGPLGTIILRDKDLGLIVRSPPLPDKPGGQMGNASISPEFRKVFESGISATTFYTPNSSDNQERIFSFLRMKDAPMLINAGMASGDYLAGWVNERNKTVAGVLGFSLVTLALGLVLWRLLQMSTQESLRNQAYLRNASDGILITDAHGHLVEANDRLCAMLGYPRHTLLDMTEQQWMACWPGEAARNAILKASEVTTDPLSLETQLRSRDGRLLEVEVSCSQFTWSNRLHVHASIRDIGERKANAEKIELLAFYDPLTNLPNRRLMLERLNRARVSCERHHRHGALMLIDMDNFKILNDTLGHGVGDQLLIEVAKRLQACIRLGDTAARMGGDEFVVILEDLDESTLAASQAEAVAEKILLALRQPFNLEMNPGQRGAYMHEHQCTSSIGLTLFNSQTLSTDEILKRSDTAMYQAKASGRNTVRFFDPHMQAAVDARAALEVDLRHAISQNQLQLYYQPQVNSDELVLGAEVLVRWQHPERGMVMPGEFIALAEETGLILPIGAWVLETACAQLTAWAGHAAFSHLTISVNVSARQFRQAGFVEQVQNIVRSSGADAHRLKLELTESLMVNDVQETVSKMAALNALGITFSLDDFGTGYSSLSYLQRLPLDQLKIDQSFVRDLLQDSKDAAIAQTVVNLAQNLGLRVIAEGVETEGQRDYLQSIGCHAFQGYLYGRPGPVQQFEQRLRGVTA